MSQYSSDETRLTLTEKHTATLFALLAHQVVTRFGEAAGRAAARQAVRHYGEQRGRRMALRAKINGDELSMTNFMVYSEWRPSTDEGEQQSSEQAADIYSRALRCAWANAWEEIDLMPYGGLYCLEIDKALVRGFNPDLVLDVGPTLSNDGVPCEFIYHTAALPDGETMAYVQRARERLQSSPAAPTFMPWEYHCGHIYKTCREMFCSTFGKDGEQAAKAALAEFAARYGEEIAHSIAGYENVDFDKLPE